MQYRIRRTAYSRLPNFDVKTAFPPN